MQAQNPVSVVLFLTQGIVHTIPCEDVKTSLRMDFQGFLLGIPSETVAANAYFLNICFKQTFQQKMRSPPVSHFSLSLSFLPALGYMNESVDIMQNTSNSKHIIYPRLLPFLSGRCMSCPFRFFSLFTFEP